MRWLVSLAAAAFACFFSAGAEAAANAAQSSPALFNRTTLSYGSTLSPSQEATRYQVMVLQATDADEVAVLHAANPGLKILLYANAIYSRASDPTGLSTCTGLAADTSSHPTWFLSDESKHRIVVNGGNAMDVGNPAYQQACVAHTVGVAEQDGFDGIMFDGLDAHPPWPTHPGVAEYPSATGWDAAIQMFLNYAGATVKADGLTVTANLSGTSESLWEQWTAPLDGSEQQGWTDGGFGLGQQVPDWSTKLAEVAWSEAHQKLTVLNSYNRTEAGNVYGLASMLLVAGGYTSYATNNANYGSYEAWYPEYAQAQMLGTPDGPYTQLSNGEYERKFSNGLVLVNPTTSSVAALSLGRSYQNGSVNTSSISLAPTTGVVLLSDAGSPAAFNRTAYEYASQLSYSQEAARYQVLIMTADDAAKVAALHAQNPDLKILLYSMALYSDMKDPEARNSCTSYATDNSGDPSWFLHGATGSRLPFNTTHDMMDMGDTAYQQSCVAHTVALAKQDGFDGVFFDGLNAYWKGFVPEGATVAKYPTKSEWQAALQSFLNYAGKTVQADGLLVMANIGGASNTLWDDWTAPLNGSQEQGFTDGGFGLAQQAPYFGQKLANDAWSEAHGKYAIEDSYNETEAGNTFGLAAMLLVADGYSSWSTSNTDDTASLETWYPEYGDAQQLGSPTGPYSVLPNGVYERRFQNGIVVVNPTISSVSTFLLGGTYSGTTTSRTSSVSLPATSGLILLASS